MTTKSYARGVSSIQLSWIRSKVNFLFLEHSEVSRLTFILFSFSPLQAPAIFGEKVIEPQVKKGGMTK